MATRSLGPIKYTMPPRGDVSYSGVAQGLDTLSSAFQGVYTNKVLSEAREGLDSTITDVLGEVQESFVTPDQLRSADELSAPEFAAQYNRLRNTINNTSGSVRTRAILALKQELQQQLEANPGFRSQLIQEFNQFVSASPELVQAGAIDDARTNDLYAQDYLDRITEETYLPMTEGGLGIQSDIPIGSVEWARLYKERKQMRVAFDAQLEELAMAKTTGELNGPRALALATNLIDSQNGAVSQLMIDLQSRLRSIAAGRIDGKLDPEAQQEWQNVTKPALLTQIDQAILGIGEGITDTFASIPEAFRDTTSYNAAQSLRNRVTDDLIRVRNYIADDNFDVVDFMNDQLKIKGHRTLGNYPMLEGIAAVGSVQEGLFPFLKDAGITNQLKAFRAGVEGGIADEASLMFESFMNGTNDGKALTAPDEQTYNKEVTKGRAKIQKSEPWSEQVRDASRSLSGLTSSLQSIDKLTPVMAQQSLGMMGDTMYTLNNVKPFIFDGSDKEHVRSLLADPNIARVFIAANKNNVVGAQTVANQFEEFWRKTSDEDFDSLEDWYSEIAAEATEPVPEVPYIKNILEVLRPVDFAEVQNGQVVFRVDESMVRVAVEANLKQRGITDKSAVAVAMRFARQRAAALSKKTTQFLMARHNRNAGTNRMTSVDYLDAYFDPVLGLNQLFPLDEDIVPKDARSPR